MAMHDVMVVAGVWFRFFMVLRLLSEIGLRLSRMQSELPSAVVAAYARVNRGCK